MSEKKKYLKEEDLKKFDEFIQNSLYKYFYVDPWERLYINTGKDHHNIISDKSTIPDLVIYNKTFNKRDCFLPPKNYSKYIKFPRIQFLLRPKKVNYYNPSCTYGEDKKEKVEEKEKEDENLKPFEFKSIPKEIEDKFTNTNKKENTENNLLLDELNDFMKSDKDTGNEAKVKIVQEYKNIGIEKKDKQKIEKEQEKVKEKEKIDKESPNVKNKQKMKTANKDNNYHKNKFETPININNTNNINMNFNLNAINNINNNYIYMAMMRQKMLQNIQYQNYISSKLGHNNNFINNNQANQFKPSQKENNKEKVNNDNNKNPTDLNGNNKDKNVGNEGEEKNKNINAISYFKNNNTNEIAEFENVVNNIDDIYKKNINNRGWKVVDNKNNNAVNIFNNEQLFYFLNTIMKRKEEINKYSISDLESDFFFNPTNIYEKLRDMLQKK